MLLTCTKCGNKFHESMIVEEREYRGECFGFPAYESVYLSPCCKYDFEYPEEYYKEQKRKMEEYLEEIRSLDGTPSEEAKRVLNAFHKPLREEFDEYNKYVYACWDYSESVTKAALEMVRDIYHITLTKDNNPYRRNGYGIQIEMPKTNPIDFYSISELDYNTFCKIFCDLRHIGCHPTAFIPLENGTNKIISNSSLGEIRLHYLKEVN